jgi:hypothetical protein
MHKRPTHFELKEQDGKNTKEKEKKKKRGKESKPEDLHHNKWFFSISIKKWFEF